MTLVSLVILLEITVPSYVTLVLLEILLTSPVHQPALHALLDPSLLSPPL